MLLVIPEFVQHVYCTLVKILVIVLKCNIFLLSLICKDRIKTINGKLIILERN